MINIMLDSVTLRNSGTVQKEFIIERENKSMWILEE